jgi:hypothetical protein
VSWIVEQAKAEFAEKSLLHLKAAAFLGIAAKTRNPALAQEALRIAERCLARALVLDAPSSGAARGAAPEDNRVRPAGGTRS